MSGLHGAMLIRFDRKQIRESIKKIENYKQKKRNEKLK